jgi:hypothetical protein
MKQSNDFPVSFDILFVDLSQTKGFTKRSAMVVQQNIDRHSCSMFL